MRALYADVGGEQSGRVARVREDEGGRTADDEDEQRRLQDRCCSEEGAHHREQLRVAGAEGHQRQHAVQVGSRALQAQLESHRAARGVVGDQVVKVAHLTEACEHHVELARLEVRTAVDSRNHLPALLGEAGAQGRDHVLQQDNGVSGNFGLRYVKTDENIGYTSTAPDGEATTVTGPITAASRAGRPIACRAGPSSTR